MTWQELSLASIDDVLTWASSQPWAQAMAECAQDPDWHAEGDVWTHTRLVCEQLPHLDEWPTLEHREQAILLFAALFHDSGKPLTSAVDPESGRIRSPKHAVKGERIARNALRELGCDLKSREEIARLVRYHSRPAYLLEKPDPNHEVVSLSWLVNNKLLYLFALADTRGRRAREMSRPEENLHFWRLAAEENDCFDRPYAFGSDHARFLFYRRPNPDLHYAPHEDYRCTVTMMAGLPGSGKDTWLGAKRGRLPVVSLDEIRTQLGAAPTGDQGEVVGLARERCRELLRESRSFAFAATNLMRRTRTRWIDLFADYGARIEIIYVEPPFPVILSQNKRRARSVPEHVIRSLAAKCEPPTWAEAHGVVLVESSGAGSAGD